MCGINLLCQLTGCLGDRCVNFIHRVQSLKASSFLLFFFSFLDLKNYFRIHLHKSDGELFSYLYLFCEIPRDESL